MTLTPMMSDDLPWPTCRCWDRVDALPFLLLPFNLSSLENCNLKLLVGACQPSYWYPHLNLPKTSGFSYLFHFLIYALVGLTPWFAFWNLFLAGHFVGGWWCSPSFSRVINEKQQILEHT